MPDGITWLQNVVLFHNAIITLYFQIELHESNEEGNKKSQRREKPGVGRP